jgi:hypothetical protein
MTSMTSVFTKHIADTLEKHEPPKTSSQIDPKSQPLGRLLYWLTHHWKKDVISVREICWRGPQATRDRKNAIAVSEILAQRGWLLPIPAHRHDRKVWKIIRETGQINAPQLHNNRELSQNH